MSRFQLPVAPSAIVTARTRGSQVAWNMAPSGSGTTGPKPLRPPMSAWFTYGMSCLADSSREAGTDHRVACDQSGQSIFAQPVGSRRTLGNHQIAHLGGRVPDADLRARRQRHPE